MNYLWLRYLQSKLLATLQWSTTQLEMKKYMSKLVKHNLPKSNKPPQLATERECDSNGLRLLQDPHPPPGSPQQQLTMLETTTGLSNAILTARKGDTTTTDQEVDPTNGPESSILQLGEHVARELGLRFGASPPHSHHSNGAAERLHMPSVWPTEGSTPTVVTQLGVQPDRLPQRALPWLLQHSVFILNKYLVKESGTTAHQNNNPICQFGEAVLADTRYLVNYKLRQRNLDLKRKVFGLARILLLMSTR